MGGIKEQLHDTEAVNLPPEALVGSLDWFDIDNFWLSGAESPDQLTAMRVWFDQRYLDGRAAMKAGMSPAAVYGILRAHDPGPILRGRFRGIVSDQAISEVVAEFQDIGGDGWAQKPEPYDPTYDEDFSISVDRQSEPLDRLKQRVVEILELQSLTGGENARALAQRLSHSAAITALESFLWETMIFWVESDDRVVQRIITEHPFFKDQKISLGSIFKKVDSLQTDILGYMQSIVWHNWTQVAPLFKYGLGVQLSLRAFDEAVKKRHDIVHRSGYTKEGIKISIQTGEIERLCDLIVAFAIEISNRGQQKIEDDDIPF